MRKITIRIKRVLDIALYSFLEKSSALFFKAVTLAKLDSNKDKIYLDSNIKKLLSL